MTIFADASALIAMIAHETDADDLAACLQANADRLCSVLAAWETVAGLCRSHAFSPENALLIVREFLDDFDFTLVSTGISEFEIAVEAYERFGKGRHPASLNMGDCFAYACARANDAKLLFKGEDFSKTDIASALAV